MLRIAKLVEWSLAHISWTRRWSAQVNSKIFFDEYGFPKTANEIESLGEPVKIPVASTQDLKSSKYEVHNRAV